MSLPLLKHVLPYTEDSSTLFEYLRALPWAMYLDSGQPRSQYGRYDIMVADPFITIKTHDVDETNPQHPTANIVTEITENGETNISTEDPFALLNEKLLGHPSLADLAQELPTGLPFTGGAVGYFGYDLGRQIETLPNIAEANAIPHMMVGIYDWAVVIDHREKRAMLVSHGLNQTTRDHWQSICALFNPIDKALKQQQKKSSPAVSPFRVLSDVTSNMDYTSYGKAFDRIKAYIKAGDCYQVNLAQRFRAEAKGEPWQAYQKLREIGSAPFMAYMHFGDLQVLSGSPERFLQVSGQHVETRPIKGTRPRDDDPAIDQQNAEALQNSQKDRAENLMIVDLLRNDISKNCTVGSVKADHLFQLQSFANVHHLVSIVTGTLDKAKTAVDLLRGAFPGGSITGAPKLRAMEIIEDLEPDRRAVYCGSVGYIGFDGNMDTNITIRTAVYKNSGETGEISFYAGGGIVADSERQKEYDETLDKASSMMAVMAFFKE